MQINHWFIIRVAMAVVIAVLTFFNWGFSESGIEWWHCLLIFAVMVVSIFVGFTYMYKTRPFNEPWSRPSWDENPFQGKSQPLQMGHAGAINAIAAGVGAAFATIAKGKYEHLSDAGMPMVMGLGILIGIHIWMMVFLREEGNE